MYIKKLSIFAFIAALIAPHQSSAMSLWFNKQEATTKTAFAASAALATSYLLYSYFSNKAKEAFQTYSEDKTVDLLLISIKPNGNCSDEELEQKARIHHFLNDLGENDLILKKALNLHDWLTNSYLSTLIKNAGLVVPNKYLNLDQYKNWLPLFFNLIFFNTGLKKTILNSVQTKLKTPNPEQAVKIKKKLVEKIKNMTDDQIENQFIPRMVRSSQPYKLLKKESTLPIKNAILKIINSADSLINAFIYAQNTNYAQNTK